MEIGQSIHVADGTFRPATQFQLQIVSADRSIVDQTVDELATLSVSDVERWNGYRWAFIQSAMPPAILNYLWAARYDNEPGEVASVVVLSTLLSIVLLPVFLWTVM